MTNTSPQPAQRSAQDFLDFVSSMRAPQPHPPPTASQHTQVYGMSGLEAALKHSTQHPGVNQAPTPTSIGQSPSSFHFPGPTQAYSQSTTAASPGPVNPQTPKQPPKLEYLDERIIRLSSFNSVTKDQYTQWLQEIQAHYFGDDFSDFEKCLAGLQAWKQLSAYFYRSHKITVGRWNDAWWIEEYYAGMAFDDVLKYGGVESNAGEVPDLEEYDDVFGGAYVDSNVEELPSLEECRRLLEGLKQ